MHKGLLVAGALLAGIAAGCGDDSDSTGGQTATAAESADVRAIRTVVDKTFNGSPKEVCATYSDRLLKRIYRTNSKCVSETESEQEAIKALRLHERGDLEDASVDDDRARARVLYKINDRGIGGRLEMRRQDDRWVVDDIDPEFLRASLSDPIQLKALNDVFPGVYSERAAQCVSDRYDDLSDQEIVDLSDAIARGDEPAASDELAVYTRCAERTDEAITLTRAFLELGAREALKAEGVDAAIASCVIKRLRRELTEKDVDAVMSNPGSEFSSPTAAVLGRALQSCSSGVT